jgi:predicted nuclease of predicted toxin-antitoxin system
VKVKVDENLPTTAAGVLRQAGYDPETVVDEGLVGASDSAISAAAASEGRILLTMDRGLGDVRAHPPGSHPGIVVLRVRDQDARATVAVVADLLDSFDLAEFSGCNVIVERDRVRVRRPR